MSTMIIIDVCRLLTFHDSFVPIHTEDDPSIITFSKKCEGCIAKLSVLFANSDEIHEYLQLTLDLKESGIHTTDEHGDIVFTVTKLELPLEFLSIMIKDKPSCLSNFDKNSARLQVKINHSDDSIDCVKSEILRNTNLDVSNEITVLSCGPCLTKPQMVVISLERPVPYFTYEMLITLQCGARIHANNSNDFPIKDLIFDLPPNYNFGDNYLKLVREIYCPKFRKKWTNPNQNNQEANIQCGHVTSNIHRSIENRKKKKSKKDDKDILSNLGSYAVHEVNNQLPKDKKGICLVINNDEFEKAIPRIGSTCDVERIERFFTNYFYHYEIFHNKSTYDLKVCLDNLQSQIKESCQQLVIFVLSHGTQNYFETFNGKMHFHELESYFSSRNCSNLENMIKLFIYSCCQGDNINNIDVKEQCKNGPEMKRHSIDRDCCRGFAAPPGYLSYTSKSRGSIFIQTLLDVIERDPSREIRDIFKEVQSSMGSIPPTSQKHHYIARSDNTLTKNAYLILTETEKMETESRPASSNTFIGFSQQLSLDTEIVNNKCQVYFRETSSEEILDQS